MNVNVDQHYSPWRSSFICWYIDRYKRIAKLISMTAKLLGSENERSRARRTESGKRIRILRKRAPYCRIWKKVEILILCFCYFLTNIDKFLTITTSLRCPHHTQKKNGLIFFFMFIVAFFVARVSDRKQAYRIHSIEARVIKQFALWKRLTNASKKEERKTLVHLIIIIIIFSLFLNCFALPRVDLLLVKTFFLFPMLTTSLLS